MKRHLIRESAATPFDSALPFLLFTFWRRADTIGPPAPPVGQQAAEVTTFASTSPFGTEPKEHPAGAEQKLLEIPLKLLHSPFIVKRVGTRGTVAVNGQRETCLRSYPSQFELLAVPRERPDLLFHKSLYRPVRAGRIVIECVKKLPIGYCRGPKSASLSLPAPFLSLQERHSLV